MDSKQKNILQASFRVVVAALASFLAWVGGLFSWFIDTRSNTTEEAHKDSYDIEAGMLVHHVGEHRTIVDTLEDEG